MSIARLVAVTLLTAVAGCRPNLPPDFPGHPNDPAAHSPVSTRGLVVSVERPRPEDSQSYVHVVISPEEGQPVRLVLAPGWYLDRQGIRFEPQQAVTAHGTRGADPGAPSIVVNSLSTSQGTFQLRDAQDRPLWSQ